MQKEKEKKNGLSEAEALPDEVLGLVAGGRDLYQSEDDYFNFIYDKLCSIGGMTDDERDNMIAYLYCIDNLRDNSPEFYYDMKADYRKVWERQTGKKWVPFKPQ